MGKPLVRNRGNMEPFSQCTNETLAKVDVLLTDVDGTLTRDGHVPTDVMTAIAALGAAGLTVIPVTGRPAGWAHMMINQWPVRAAIAENGAMAYVRHHSSIKEIFALGRAGSETHQTNAMAIAAAAFKEFPHLALAGDQPYRRVDLAIDHAENVDPLSVSELAALRGFLMEKGAHVIISSIHVHIQLADFDKAAMAKRVINDYLDGVDADAVLAVGDAPNDEPLFAAFSLCVGVANLAKAAAGMTSLPRYITAGAEADGFCELAARLIAART